MNYNAAICPGMTFHGPNATATTRNAPEIENAIPRPTEEA